MERNVSPAAADRYVIQAFNIDLSNLGCDMVEDPGCTASHAMGKFRMRWSCIVHDFRSLASSQLWKIVERFNHSHVRLHFWAKMRLRAESQRRAASEVRTSEGKVCGQWQIWTRTHTRCENYQPPAFLRNSIVGCEQDLLTDVITSTNQFFEHTTGYQPVSEREHAGDVFKQDGFGSEFIDKAVSNA